MKKLALVIASLMLAAVLFASCTTTPADSTPPDTTDPISDGTIEPEGGDTTAPASNDTTAPVSDDTAEPAPDTTVPENGYALGTISGTGFSSDWLGFEFTLTDGLEISDASELGQTIPDSAKYIDAATGDERIDWSKVDVAYEMMATVTETGGNVVVMTEKVDKGVNVKKYVEFIKDGFSSDEEISVTYEKLTDSKIAGEKYTRFDYVITIYGMEIEQTMFIRKIDDRMVSICITASDDNEMDTFLSCFKAK